MNTPYKRKTVIELRQLLYSLGLPTTGNKTCLLQTLNDYGSIPPPPTKLDHLDTYQDWENGGGWIKGLIFKFVRDTQPDYDYEMDTEDCDCDLVCRCGTIVNIQMNRDDPKMPFDLVKESLFYLYATDEVSDIGKYYIFRTLSLLFRDCCQNDDFEPLFEPEPVWGYYGEEFNVICHIKHQLYSKLSDGINLNELLRREYDNNQYEVDFIDIVEIDPNIIDIPNKIHFQKCLEENIYEWYHGIIAICSFQNNVYKLKDGYHRLASSIARGDLTVKVIVATFN